MTYETYLKKDKEIRQAFWLKFGRIVSEEKLLPFSQPGIFHPAWPGDERRFLLVHTHQETSLAFTDGLSDLSDSDVRYENKNGLEIELFLETSERLEDIKSGWALALLLQVSRVAVNHGLLKEEITQRKFMTVQLDMDGAPPEWSLQHPDGNVGVFLSVARPGMQDEIKLQKTSFSPICVKLMRPAELRYALDHGAVGREKLAELYSTPAGLGHISSLTRPSVI